MATVLSQMAKDLDDELGRAAQAADALATALGPELAAKADVGSIVGDLQRMGLTLRGDRRRRRQTRRRVEGTRPGPGERVGLRVGWGRHQAREHRTVRGFVAVGDGEHGRQRQPGPGCARRGRRVGRCRDRPDGRVHGRRRWLRREAGQRHRQLRHDRGAAGRGRTRHPTDLLPLRGDPQSQRGQHQTGRGVRRRPVRGGHRRRSGRDGVSQRRQGRVHHQRR